MAKQEEKKLAQVFHFDLYGKREDKYNFLNENSLNSINWTELNPQAPELFFVPKDFDVKGEYDEGFSVNELFVLNGVGLTTAHDEFVINEKNKDLLEFYKKFQSAPRDAEYLHKEFKVKKKEGWNILQGYDNIQKETDLTKFIKPISYRPFDNRFVFYEDKLVWRTVRKVMQHFLKGENVGLAGIRTNKEKVGYTSVFITKNIAEARLSDRFITNVFPLYLYPDEKNKDLFETGQERTPNLNLEIVNQIATGLGLSFVAETPMGHDPLETKTIFSPIDLLDYIYAVLHSPSYREKYKEFLKIDFPRVPYPKYLTTFEKLSNLGSQLRQIHLLESFPKAFGIEKYITGYPEDGDNVVTKPRFAPSPLGRAGVGSVYINDTQYFTNVTEVAWNFYIGGYQPAQKWLKDRKERKLEFEDILHYQKIIVALTETDRLMKEIDKVEIE
jgi:predicted helicase